MTKQERLDILEELNLKIDKIIELLSPKKELKSNVYKTILK